MVDGIEGEDVHRVGRALALTSLPVPLSLYPKLGELKRLQEPVFLCLNWSSEVYLEHTVLYVEERQIARLLLVTSFPS